MTEEALKFDNGKLPMDLLDPEWMEGVAQVLQFGAQKYAAHNWRKGMEWSRLYAAIQRHLNAFAKGWEYDDETGLSHLLHASCGLMFLYEMQRYRRDLNDMYWADKSKAELKPLRPTAEAVAKVVRQGLMGMVAAMQEEEAEV